MAWRQPAPQGDINEERQAIGEHNAQYGDRNYPGWAVCGSRDQPVPAGLSGQLECFRNELADLKDEVDGINGELGHMHRTNIKNLNARVAAMEACHGDVVRATEDLERHLREVEASVETRFRELKRELKKISDHTERLDSVAAESGGWG
jgi:hypothetical protein